MADTSRWEFEGFVLPTYTQVPDEFFDIVAPRLTEAELRVGLYIIRRTFGFKKGQDAISLNQMISGIKTRDGRILDYGTGLSRKGVVNGVKGLTEKKVIVVDKQIGDDGVNQVNVYRLNIRGVVSSGDYGSHLRYNDVQGVVSQGDYGSFLGSPGVVSPGDSQQTVQETVEQETDVEDSNAHNLSLTISVNDRFVIERYIKDWARELNDQAPLSSSVTRACRLYVESGVSLDVFAERMIEARRRTQQHSGSIRTEATAGRATKPKMSYWFATLESLVSAKP